MEITSPLVLMYHGIVDGKCPLPEDRETGADLYDLSAEQFDQHMAFLQQNGYTVRQAKETSNFTNKDVVITFDDGELNNHKVALPILKKFGFTAYFFIIVSRVGRKGYMTWEEIKELHDQGMIVGSHGLSHQILTSLLDSQIDEELRASKRTIEVNLDIPVDTISIPRGFCNEALIQKAYELGYKTIFISDRPADVKSPCLSRIAVKNNWKVRELQNAILGKKTVTQRAFLSLKKFSKCILKEEGYNKIRSGLIKVFK
ncbi:MAG: polysaccharide deacetylase family protein [Candidatus Omnitrophica bacterium]|nr:polysaccharide deacetylase family protein [Candidatus Omnitrophota bacterium]